MILTKYVRWPGAPPSSTCTLINNCRSKCFKLIRFCWCMSIYGHAETWGFKLELRTKLVVEIVWAFMHNLVAFDSPPKYHRPKLRGVYGKPLAPKRLSFHIPCSSISNTNARLFLLCSKIDNFFLQIQRCRCKLNHHICNLKIWIQWYHIC